MADWDIEKKEINWLKEEYKKDNNRLLKENKELKEMLKQAIKDFESLRQKFSCVENEKFDCDACEYGCSEHYVQKNPTLTIDGFIKVNAEILVIAEMKRIVEEAEANREYKGFTKEQLSEMKKIIDEEFNRLIGGDNNG